MRSFLMLLLGLLLVNCSAGGPSERDARQVFEAQLRGLLPGEAFQIDSFTKTNGQETNELGVAGYRVFYRAVVSFPNGLQTQELGPGLIPVDRHWWRPVPPGTRITYEGRIAFQRSENGWVASGIELTNRSIQ